MIWICIGGAVLMFLMIAQAVYYRVMNPSVLKIGNGKTKIACVGDSITYSLGVLGKRKKYSYPALLVKKLGDEYSSYNYGLSDRTLLSTADKPYFNEKLGKQAWDTDADIVIFMLGSNDCKRKNWNAEQFKTEYDGVIKHYLDMGVKKLIVMLPPRLFVKATKTGYDNAILTDELIPIVTSLAEKHGIPCVDLYSLTASHREWFPDKLHPNKEGNQAIADMLAKVIK